MRKITMLLACAVAVLAFAAPAFAQTATQDTYEGLAGAQQGGGDDGTVADSSSGGSLPFTGLELALIGGLGAGLFAGGIAVRRASRFREGTS